MKKTLLRLTVLAAIIAVSLSIVTYAEPSEPSFQIQLSSNANMPLQYGDIVTVSCTLRRTDAAEDWDMYAWQTEIAFDNTVFSLVNGSITAAEGISGTYHTGSAENRVYLNAYSACKIGTVYPAEVCAGSFQLKIVSTSGPTTISNKNYLVSKSGGYENYAVNAIDLELSLDRSSFPHDDATQFRDVAVGSWYETAIADVVNAGLFYGTGQELFTPDGSMTRAMLVTVLYRMSGSPAVAAENTFLDVEDGQWYTQAILWANASGIVRGYGNGYFGTNDAVTREQMAVLLYRYAVDIGLSTKSCADLSRYTDAAEISSWAVDAMCWANAAGLITGRTATTLAPQGTATRAEVATILMRFRRL